MNLIATTGNGKLASTTTSSRGAIVLGSAQSADVVDRSECERLDLDIVTRRSGGGLVLVGHDREVWLDVLLPF